MPKIKTTYVKTNDYAPTYANGVIGGVNVKGEIVINFFAEFNALPTFHTYDLNGQQLVQVAEEVAELTNAPFVNINRTIHTGVILNANSAMELYKWLGQQLEVVNKNQSTNDTK